jgi:hypothetical protein
LSSPILYIGVSGKMRHGKDTFAAFVKEELTARGHVAVCRGMSAALKEEVAEFLSWELDDHPDWQKIPANQRYEQMLARMHSSDPREKEPLRLIMQWWGTEFRREMFCKDYWTRKLGEWAENTQNNLPGGPQLVVLIPDIRLTNERSFVKERDGLTVRVLRPGVEETSVHITETELAHCDDWDRLILNDGTLEQLRQAADIFCATIEARLLEVTSCGD